MAAELTVARESTVNPLNAIGNGRSMSRVSAWTTRSEAVRQAEAELRRKPNPEGNNLRVMARIKVENEQRKAVQDAQREMRNYEIEMKYKYPLAGGRGNIPDIAKQTKAYNNAITRRRQQLQRQIAQKYGIEFKGW